MRKEYRPKRLPKMMQVIFLKLLNIRNTSELSSKVLDLGVE